VLSAIIGKYPMKDKKVALLDDTREVELTEDEKETQRMILPFQGTKYYLLRGISRSNAYSGC